MKILRTERKLNECRKIEVVKNYTKYTPGSVLISYGDTKVICAVSIEDRIPHFLRDSGRGWLTAEYSLLPSATHTRVQREVNKGKPSGRTNEIQRLIGRALRSIVDFEVLGERTITIDADVIQADGGTRTAAITGSMIALNDAVTFLMREGKMSDNPLKGWLAAVSVGVVKGEVLCDLNYEEDSQADVDMNVVMTEKGEYVEIQGTAENQTFDSAALSKMLDSAGMAIKQIIKDIKKL